MRIERSYAPYVETGDQASGDVVQGRRSRARHVDAPVDQGAAIRRRHRSAARRLRAGRIVVRDVGGGAGHAAGPAGRGVGRLVHLVAARRLRSRGAPRRSRGALRHAPERRPPQFTYVVRATTAGTFRTAPAHAEEMYEPEVFGRTATAVIEVEADSMRGDVVLQRARSAACAMRRGRRLRVARPSVVAARRCSGCALGPIPAALLDGVDTPSTVVVDRHGRVLYEALSADGTRGAPLEAGACRRCSWRRRSRPRIGASTRIPASTPSRLLRAARHNLREGRVVEGGSTITQQVAKLLIRRARASSAAALARSCARWCWRCGSSTASPSARSSRCT